MFHLYFTLKRHLSNFGFCMILIKFHSEIMSLPRNVLFFLFHHLVKREGFKHVPRVSNILAKIHFSSFLKLKQTCITHFLL